MIEVKFEQMQNYKKLNMTKDDIFEAMSFLFSNFNLFTCERFYYQNKTQNDGNLFFSLIGLLKYENGYFVVRFAGLDSKNPCLLYDYASFEHNGRFSELDCIIYAKEINPINSIESFREQSTVELVQNFVTHFLENNEKMAQDVKQQKRNVEKSKKRLEQLQMLGLDGRYSNPKEHFLIELPISPNHMSDECFEQLKMIIAQMKLD